MDAGIANTVETRINTNETKALIRLGRGFWVGGLTKRFEV
jgi:hypothetical protein